MAVWQCSTTSHRIHPKQARRTWLRWWHNWRPTSSGKSERNTPQWITLPHFCHHWRIPCCEHGTSRLHNKVKLKFEYTNRRPPKNSRHNGMLVFTIEPNELLVCISQEQCMPCALLRVIRQRLLVQL